jgi:hypothetical protein
MTVEVVVCAQNSPEWFAARMGIPTASSFHTVMARGKDGGRSITRDDYMRKLAGEILTEEPAPEGYSNGYMERGKFLEPDARAMFAFMQDVEPEVVGFVRNGRKGASPDSFISTDAGLEIKTAIPAVQIDRLQQNRVPPEYVAQVQGCLWVSERDHWWFMSYCPKLPPLIVRVGRDDTYIAKLSAAVDAFNEELDNLVNSIRGVDQFRRVA